MKKGRSYKINSGLEERNFLIQKNETKLLDHKLLVETEPCKVLFLETSLVDYWFFCCIYNNEPALLEQRIEFTANGEVIDETIKELSVSGNFI